ncbi:type IV pilus assembly protein FimV [Rhodoferax antarcticus]|uniref:type IV pilus assembly protein FimV n=1 Tax=Rhodoferax antarcticus TaxID=81479 RepID=UPI002225AFEF|nr:hypothetical protein [Rhodoferax antarcticus]
MTLGDLRGNAVIGRSLDVSVPVSPGSGEEVNASCLSAEVLQGDAQRMRASVTVSPETSSAVSVSMVRIRSAAAVDEPVVTVMLRSTCAGLTTRQYVLLSDFPAPDLPQVATAAVAAAKPPVRDAGRTDEADVADVAPKPAAPVKKRPKPRPAVIPVPPPAPPEPELAKPVLKLDPTPALPDQAQVPASAALPALAAASAPSDEVALQAARMEALQADIKALKDLAIKNEVTLVDLQAKLRQAEAERVPMTWLYLLGGLLIATLGALTWVLRRQQVANKGDDVWWQQGRDAASETLVVAPPASRQSEQRLSDFGEAFEPVEPIALEATESSMPAELQADTDLHTDLDTNLDIDLGSLAPADEAPTASQPLDLLPADRSAATHPLNGEGVSDIRQQAEFFVSLGQSERAINVLRKQVMEGPQPNPLVYLDLLGLYQAQGMRTDFLELRAAFSRFFNGVVPDFSTFNLAGSELLDYPEPLAVLVRFWPNIEAIAFLEACIFRNDAAPMQLSFDLPAFRDLLMLHAVAENVTSESPWKMTNLDGLGDITTGPADWAGMAMDPRGKPEA